MLRPIAIACSISEGLFTPGKIGTSFPKQYSHIDGLKPGETINCAPAEIAASTSSFFVTVPAPIKISS